jgi:hypothetical protein
MLSITPVPKPTFEPSHQPAEPAMDAPSNPSIPRIHSLPGSGPILLQRTRNVEDR